MKQIGAAVPSIENWKLYIFLSAFSVNLFLEVTLIANELSIPYFLYAFPATIRFNFISPTGDTLLWVGSLYLVYFTKEVIERTAEFSRIHRFLNMALVGSFLLLASIFLDVLNTSANWIQFPVLLTGSILSFVGTTLSLFTMLAHDRNLLRLFLIYVISLLIPIEIWSLAHWFAYPFNVSSYLGFAWQGSFIELQLFYVTYPVIFLLFIGFLSSWLWVPSFKFAMKRLLGMGTRVESLLFEPWRCSEPSEEAVQASSQNTESHNHRFQSLSANGLILTFFAFLAIFVAYYPYINPTSGLVGWDTLGYYASLSRMANQNFYSAVQFVMTTDRPLFFLIVHFLQNLLELSSYEVVTLIPIFTILANSAAVFWLLRTAKSSALVSFLAVVFSLFSFNTTVAMQSGIFANWLAIALGFVMFGLVLKLHERFSWKLFAGGILAWAAVFLIHYWSGIFLLLIFGCYVFLTVLQTRSRRMKVAAYSLFGLSAFTLLFFSGNLASYFFPDYGLAENVGLGQAFGVFSTKLPVLIDFWFYGSWANPIMMALALVGIVACFQKRTNLSRLLISWVIIGSILSVFVSPIGRNMDQWLIWRTLYLIPFQIPAALGLSLITARLGFFKDRISSQSCNVESQNVKHRFALKLSEDHKDFSLILITNSASAFLLILDFPLAMVLFILNFTLLTLVVHFRIRRGDSNSIAAFLFILLVCFMLLNYCLRSLAPLATNRMQI